MVAAWQVRGWLGDEWRWNVNKPWEIPGWLPARVPGSVMDDLARAGELPDLYHGRNSLFAEWVENRTWVYRTRVTGPARVRFEGVDHESTVFVDGEEVAHHEGAFTPFEAEVPEGGRLLVVAVHAARTAEAQVGFTSKVKIHKSRMGYGWDFCPRLVHQGIWRPVVVDPLPERFPVVRLKDDVGTVKIDGDVVLRVDSPELWWPNGMGEQRLYDAGGFQVGFRAVQLDDYALLVNGVRAPIKGWNWVPLDVLYGVPRPEKLEHMLWLAQRSNANLLRVWGGGLIETPQFYELCDRLGLLVWQDFVQSSSGIESVPSADPEFIRTLVHDARHLVPRLRRHPSLAVWCGGNELDGDDSTPVLGALRDVVHELDPERGWLPTSPLGDAHVHGPWEHQGLQGHNEHYDTRTSKLHSEFGVEGMTNRRALEALIDEEDRWPADRSGYGSFNCVLSARFATAAWGGLGEARATLMAPARFVDLDGSVVAEVHEGELTAPLDAFAHDVFLLDVGARNRYVMTTTEDLSPLLELPRTELALERASDTVSLANTGHVAALGIVLEDARPYDAPGWVTFSDNVFDLLPGEKREIEVQGPIGELRVAGWNALV